MHSNSCLNASVTRLTGVGIGCVTQARRHLNGQERSVELAILGRLGAEVEYEICHLLEAKGVT